MNDKKYNPKTKWKKKASSTGEGIWKTYSSQQIITYMKNSKVIIETI